MNRDWVKAAAFGFVFALLVAVLLFCGAVMEGSTLP